ncbi:MAG: TM2 domain-containing protein [Defluviitaleaceae bacterium]|nr:TM2 domain-containing protein [Defluviitaleaceae bacterium]
MQGYNNRADMWLMTKANFFKPEHMPYITEQVRNLNDNQLNVLMSVNLKEPTTILLLSIFLGAYGVDRFMLGDIGMGVGKLLTGGGCGIWWLIDIFMVMDRAKEINYQLVVQALGYTSSYLQ